LVPARKKGREKLNPTASNGLPTQGQELPTVTKTAVSRSGFWYMTFHKRRKRKNLSAVTIQVREGEGKNKSNPGQPVAGRNQPSELKTGLEPGGGRNRASYHGRPRALTENPGKILTTQSGLHGSAGQAACKGVIGGGKGR